MYLDQNPYELRPKSFFTRLYSLIDNTFGKFWIFKFHTNLNCVSGFDQAFLQIAQSMQSGDVLGRRYQLQFLQFARPSKSSISSSL